MIKYRNIYKYIMAIVLLLYISFMIILSIILPDRKFSDSENRILEQKPSLCFSRIINGKFTSDYEKYISDQFPLRDLWIGLKSDTERVLGKKENNGVYLCKDGYLMQKFNKPSKSDLDDRISAINSFAKSTPNLNKYFMLVPNSIKILSDKLPKFISPADQFKYINVIKNSTGDNLTFVDISDVLSDKKDEYIYYKTDHHWTTKGAYYAYKELSKFMNFTAKSENYFNIKNVTNNFYGSLYSKGGFRHIDPDSINLYIPKDATTKTSIWYSESNKTVVSPYNIDNLNKKDKYTIFFNSNHPLVKISTNIKNNKKLLIIKDSYANSLVPFLMEHYNKIYMIDPRYYKDSINNLIDSNKIEDILILYNVNTFFGDASVNNIGAYHN